MSTTPPTSPTTAKRPARKKRPPAPADPPAQVLVTVHEVARHLGCTTRTVENYKRESPPIPMASSGGSGRPCLYDLAAVDGWWETRADKKQESGGLQAALTRKADIEARLKELDLRKREGELVEVDDIKATLARGLAMLRTELRSLPVRYGKAAGLSREKRARLAKEIDAALDRCAAAFRQGEIFEDPE